MATYLNNNTKCAYVGLSTDVKPLNLDADGAMLYEMDTGNVYMYSKKNNEWSVQAQAVSWVIYNNNK